MSRFCHKPIVVEAYRFEATSGTSQSQPDWLRFAFVRGTAWYQGGPQPYITVKTPEGEVRVKVGDWIICGAKGNLFPCKPDIFEATYEAVST